MSLVSGGLFFIYGVLFLSLSHVGWAGYGSPKGSYSRSREYSFSQDETPSKVESNLKTIKYVRISNNIESPPVEIMVPHRAPDTYRLTPASNWESIFPPQFDRSDRFPPLSPRIRPPPPISRTHNPFIPAITQWLSPSRPAPSFPSNPTNSPAPRTQRFRPPNVVPESNEIAAVKPPSSVPNPEQPSEQEPPSPPEITVVRRPSNPNLVVNQPRTPFSIRGGKKQESQPSTPSDSPGPGATDSNIPDPVINSAAPRRRDNLRKSTSQFDPPQNPLVDEGDGEGFWMGWTAWSQCTRTCGGGTYMRMRMCMPMGSNCVGRVVEMRGCNTDACPLAQWGSWGQWKQCDSSCIRQRERTCLTSEKQYVVACKGSEVDKRLCAPQFCSSFPRNIIETSTQKVLVVNRVQVTEEVDGKSINPSSIVNLKGESEGGESGSSQSPDGNSGSLSPKWGSWGDWSSCGADCKKSRSRDCQSTGCPGEGAFQSTICSDGACFKTLGTNGGSDIDSEDSWTQWSEWTQCDCANRIRRRSRVCEGGGHICPGSGVMTEECGCGDDQDAGNGLSDRVAGRWEPWSAWTACNCLHKIHSRYRKCDGVGCLGPREDERNCLPDECPKGDGGSLAARGSTNTWSPFGAWSECSSTCGEGIQSRRRICLDRDCDGPQLETKVCTNGPCSSLWTPWTSWTACSASCGAGKRRRVRTCPSVLCGNQTAEVDQQDCATEQDCLLQLPAVTSDDSAFVPLWGDWSSWSSCDCYTGRRYRMRSCSSPKPPTPKIHAPCMGPKKEMEDCTSATQCAAVNGLWTEWSLWSDCPKECGCQGARAVRLRSCTDPIPVNQGKDCFGSGEEYKGCNNLPCSNEAVYNVDGSWAEWSSWAACDLPCGSGIQRRGRDCTAPKPQFAGSFCAGSLVDTKRCTNPTPCPVSNRGGWTEWSSWSECGVTCGVNVVAYRSSYRECANPRPYLGPGAVWSRCSGRVQWTKQCHDLKPCPKSDNSLRRA